MMSADIKQYEEMKDALSQISGIPADNTKQIEFFQYQPKQASCPNCGYCPHCGRGGYHYQPYYPFQQPYIYCQPSTTGIPFQNLQVSNVSASRYFVG